MLLATFLILLGISLLYFGGEVLVDNAIRLARSFQVTPTVIGLTVVSIGTSLPELVAALAAVRRKQLDIAVGSVVGSNIFNTLLVTGVSAVVSPMPIPRGGHLDLMVTGILSLVLWLRARTHSQVILRYEGAGLLTLYLAYMVWRVVDLGG